MKRLVFILLIVVGACMVPSKMEGSVDLATGKVQLQTTETALVEPVAGSVIVKYEYIEVDRPMGVLGWVTLAFGAVGFLNTASPKGLRNIWTFIRPGSEWWQTWKAGGALLGITDSPPKAEAPADQPVKVSGFAKENGNAPQARA